MRSRAFVAWGFAGISLAAAMLVACSISEKPAAAESANMQDRVIPAIADVAVAPAEAVIGPVPGADIAANAPPVPAEIDAMIKAAVTEAVANCAPPTKVGSDDPPKCNDSSEDYTQRCHKAAYHPAPRSRFPSEQRYTNDDLPPDKAVPKTRNAT